MDTNNIIVLGAGESGVGAAVLARKKGFDVFVSDNNKIKGKYKIFHIPLDISVQSVIRKRAIMKWREAYGHIHYFTKDIALAALKDTGYEIIDYYYAPGSIELPNRNFKSSLLELPRKLLFSLTGTR